MKKYSIIVLLVVAFAMPAAAQFTKATLQATGLTCAMCSNAINKALMKVPFVESVRSDIKNSSFGIQFRKDKDVNIDALKDAVEDAGFSVGNLKLTGNFQDVKVENDKHITIGGEVFHFLNVNDQVLSGEQTIMVVDKHFLTAKQFRKFSAATQMKCVDSGKAAACCVKDGIAADARVYHVTI